MSDFINCRVGYVHLIDCTFSAYVDYNYRYFHISVQVILCIMHRMSSLILLKNTTLSIKENDIINKAKILLLRM